MNRPCNFCKKNIQNIDYRDPQLLKRFLSGWARIKLAKKTGTCHKHQKKLTQAIKRARFLAIVPYVNR